MHSIKFRFPFSDRGKTGKAKPTQLAPSLNVQIRENPFKKTSRKEVVMRYLREQLYGMELNWDSVNIRFIRCGIRLLDPIDNLGSSFKAIGDALVQAKVISDDNPNVISQFQSLQIKAKSKSEQYVEVTIFKCEKKETHQN